MVKISCVAVLVSLAGFSQAIPHTIEARAASCMDHLPASSLADVNDAVWCINYLASLGNKDCVASVSGTAMCKRGRTQITGLTRDLPSDKSAKSSCQNVARGAGVIMDKCSRGDGKVRGQNAAWGNGHLMVDIRAV